MPCVARVLDAGALSWLEDRPGCLGTNCILTPHPGEAARLLGVSVDVIESNRLSALQQLVDKYQCVIVLKGAYTLIGCPRGRISLCPFGTPGLATAGSGDVLAGVLGGLLAQGFSAWDAATCGVVYAMAARHTLLRRVSEP